MSLGPEHLRQKAYGRTDVYVYVDEDRQQVHVFLSEGGEPIASLPIAATIIYWTRD